jgi:Tfp pilus assembly protein PilE
VTDVPLTRLGVPRSSITRTGDTADGYRVVSARRLAHPHNPLTVLEIGLVVSVIGIAAAVAVPEYLHLRQDARDDAAKTRLAAAERTLEARHAAAGTFAGVKLPESVRVQAARGSYCVETSAGDHVWHATRHSKPAAGTC